MKYLLSLFLAHIITGTFAQEFTPDLHDKKLWRTIGRTSELITKDNQKIVYLNENGRGGLYILNGFSLAEGTVEFDVKGRSLDRKSFVGLAFHITSDSAYSSIFFRPFNFHTSDTVRIKRAVQYVSVPGHDWAYLRNKFPGRYERQVGNAPQPDDWFHVKIEITTDSVFAFVNNSTVPCFNGGLLKKGHSGELGFLTGNNSDGNFSNLRIVKRK